MEPFAFSGLINGILALGFGILVLLKNPKAKTNRLFFFMTVAVTFWSLSYWQWLSSREQETALTWVRMLTVGSVVIPVLFFHWVSAFLGIDRGRKLRWFIVSIYILIPVFLSLTFSDQLIKGVGPKLQFPFWPDAGPFYSLYLAVLYLGLIVVSLVFLFRTYRVSSDQRKGQILYIILGTVFGFGGGLTNFFLWYDIPIAPYGNFLVALFPFFLGYAVIKHRLFQIEVITAELLTFSVWMFLLIRVLLGETFRERLIDGSLLIVVIGFGIVLIRGVLMEYRQRRRLEELNKLKSAFLSFASHQIKSPMAVVKGYATLLAEGEYGHLPFKAKETAKHIRDTADQLVGVVNNFLDLRRIEEGKMAYRFEPFDTVEVTRAVTNDLSLLAKEKGLSLNFDGPASPIWVNADETKLRQVIQNLIDNAIKYTNQGWVKVNINEESESNELGKTATALNQDHINRWVLITVEDSGHGISKEVLPTLFTQFSRDPRIARKINGTGLGLYIASEIIKAHGGQIWAESDGEGKGSTFFVRLKNANLNQNPHEKRVPSEFNCFTK